MEVNQAVGAAALPTPQPTTLRSQRDLFARMLRYAKPYVGVILIAAVFTALFAGGRIGRAALIKPIFDDVLGPMYSTRTEASNPATGPDAFSPLGGFGPSEDAERAPLQSRPWNEVSPEQRAAFVRVVYLSAVIVLVMPLAMMGRSYLFSYTLGRIAIDIQRQLARKLLALPLSFHRQFRTGDIVARTLNDAEKSQTSLQVFFAEAMQAGTSIAVRSDSS